MSEPAVAYVSHGDYLALEERAEIKHEYLDGVVRAMAGGTIEHARLASRLDYLVRAALRGRPCEAFSSDARVRLDSANRSTYPDLSIVCGQLERSTDDPEAIANPIVLVEILSPSTEGYDRGDKFRFYRRFPSLREYVLVSQAEPSIEVWRRDGAAWLPIEHGPGGTVELASIEITISVDELYASALAS
ncbi:MAG: Uma2 family endonuclease [Sandaracinaceae bacterium]|nr:Uma2 family endonuclease [Sandaracinaceae bacterium]